MILRVGMVVTCANCHDRRYVVGQVEIAGPDADLAAIRVKIDDIDVNPLAEHMLGLWAQTHVGPIGVSDYSLLSLEQGP